MKDLPEQAYSRSRPPFSRRDRGSKFRGFSAVGPLLPTLGAQLSTFSIYSRPPFSPRERGSGLPSPFGCRSASLDLERAAFHLLVPNVLSHVPDPPPFFALRSGVWIKDLPGQAYSRSRPLSRAEIGDGSKFRGFSAVGPLLPTLGAQLSTFSIF